MDAILRFAGKEGATCLEHSDFFMAIHLVYLAFQQRTLLQVSPPAASPPSFHHFQQIASPISLSLTRHIANAAQCWKWILAGITVVDTLYHQVVLQFRNV